MIKAKQSVAGSKVNSKACATRALLLDAAVKVIGDKGYSSATVDEIVEVAGVSKGTAFYHFKNKAEIAASVLEDGIGQLIEEFHQVIEAAPNGPRALEGMMEVFATRIFENKQFGRFFVSELWRDGRAWSEGMRETERDLVGLIQGQLQRGKDEGFARPEINVEFEAVSLIGMVLTTSLYYIGEKGNVNKEEFIANITDFVRHANMKSPEEAVRCWG